MNKNQLCFYLQKYLLRNIIKVPFLSIMLIVLLSASCDELGTSSNAFIGTWSYSNYEFKQDIITNSDQTTTPMIGTMSGLVPFENGLVIEGDGINETLNYMYVFMGILNMGFMEIEELMNSAENSEDMPESLCMLNMMLSDDIDEDDKIDWIIMCGGSYYMGNFPENAMQTFDEQPDYLQPLISLDQPVTFYNFEPDNLQSDSFTLNTTNNDKMITISGSISYPNISVPANTPTDFMKLQLGITLEEFFELQDVTLDYEIGGIRTIIIDEDKNITTYEMIDYDDETMQITAMDTCVGTWSLSGDILSISEDFGCTGDDEDDNEDDYNDEDDGHDPMDQDPTMTINSDGNLSVGIISSNLYCDMFDSNEFGMVEGDDEPETESECKTALEAMLLFETGSIDSVDITIKLIFTSGSNSIARINQDQTKFDITQMQNKVVDWVSQFGPQLIDYNNK